MWRVIVVSLLLPLAGCTPRLLEPDSGPRATLVLPIVDHGENDRPIYPQLHVYADNEECVGRQVVQVGENRQGGAYTIAAGDEITVGFISDLTGTPGIIPMPTGPLITDGSLEFCNNIFTFTPSDGETYIASPSVLATACKFELRDASDAVVGIVKRTPIRHGRPSAYGTAFCEPR